MRKRVVGYARVSTDQQADNGYGIEVQIEKIKGWCNVMDHELVTIVKDEGFSGKSLDRPGIQHVLDLLRAGEVDGVVILKLDRITRSTKDLGYLLQEFFGPGASCPSQLLSVYDNLDTTTANGRMVVHIMGTISQWEREVISERTKAALAVKIDKGERVGRPRFGTEVKNGELVSNPKEQAVVEVAKRLKDGGLSWNAVATKLTADGFRSRTGKPLQAVQVQRMLGYKAS